MLFFSWNKSKETREATKSKKQGSKIEQKGKKIRKEARKKEQEREKERERERQRKRKWKKGRRRLRKTKGDTENKTKRPFLGGKQFVYSKQTKERKTKQTTKIKNKEGLGPSEVATSPKKEWKTRKKGTKKQEKTKIPKKIELFSCQAKFFVFTFGGSKISLFWQLGQKGRTTKTL